MRCSFLVAALCALALAISGRAEAGVVAHIDLSNQRMNVYVNGKPRYNWPVSTARRGYRTPTGTFKPTALVAITPRASMKARRCPIRSSSCAAMPSMAPTRRNISGDPSRMGASGSIPPTRPRSIR